MHGPGRLTAQWKPIEGPWKIDKAASLSFKFFLSIVYIFALYCLTGPGLVRAENLLEIYQLAVNNDPQFLAARANLEAEKQITPQARSLLLPSIDASAKKTRNSDDTTVTPDPGSSDSGSIDFDKTEYSLNLRQPIYNGASFAALRQAKASVRKAEAEFKISNQQLITRTAQAYFGVLLANDNLKLASAEKTAAQQQLDLANARLGVGLATITEVHEARARFQLAEAREIEAENSADTARDKLRELTSQDISMLSELHPTRFLTTFDDGDLDTWTSRALTLSPTILSAEAAVEIAKQEIGVQRSGHYPTLDIVGSSSINDQDGSISLPGSEIHRESNSVGIELKLNLFQGGFINALSEEAKLRFQSARYELDTAKRQVTTKVKTFYLAVSSSSKRIAALEQAVVASESALEAKSEGFKAGVSTNQDVLDAQRDLYQAKRDHADAQYSYIIDLFNLKETAGTLEVSDITMVNQWLK